MFDMVSWPASIPGRRPLLGWVWRPDRFILPSLTALLRHPGIPKAPAELPATDTELSSLPAPAILEAHVHDLYVRYARALLGYLYHRLPSLADAEDVLAEIFVSALQATTLSDAPGPGWLMIVARRRIADFYRERRRAPLTEDDLHVEERRLDPEWMALRAEERVELLALVAELPAEQQDVLSLRFAGGLRSAEIASLIGKTDEATRALLSRAIRRLRKEWRA